METTTPNLSQKTNPDNSTLPIQPEPKLTSQGNAQRFADLFAETVRYIPTRGWFVFSQTHWQPVKLETMLSLARQSLEYLLEYTYQLPDEEIKLCDRILKHLAHSESPSKLRNMLSLVRTIPTMRLSYNELDTHPFLLNLRNGTLDLHTMELHPHNPRQFLSQILPYDYDPLASNPIWSTFLEQLVGPNPDLQRYLQRAVGSSLFGASAESTAFMLTGSSQRAHKLFLSTLRQLFGSYSTHSRAFKEQGLTHKPLTSRLLTISSSAFMRSEPALLSAIIQHEPLTITRSSTDLVYQPLSTLWLSSPKLPQFSEELDFLRDFIQPIPVALTLAKDEATQLAIQLQDALPTILNWAISGFQLSHHETPPTDPLCIQQINTIFHEDQDPLTLFLAQSCTTDPDATILTKELYQAYRTWTQALGQRPLSNARFSAHILSLGYQRIRHSSHRLYQGLTLTKPDTFSQTGTENQTQAA